MLKKYALVTDSELEPFVNCSLNDFLNNCPIITFEELEMDEDELETYEEI